MHSQHLANEGSDGAAFIMSLHCDFRRKQSLAVRGCGGRAGPKLEKILDPGAQIDHQKAQKTRKNSGEQKV